jgi:hypothetical protein
VAVKEVMGTVRALDVAGIMNAVTVGAVASAWGRVIVTLALREVETLLAASLAHAKRVFAPSVPEAKLAGGDGVKPAEGAGGVDDSVTR